MSTPLDDGGPAFATSHRGYPYGDKGQRGMSLRDWFAGSVNVTQREILDYLDTNGMAHLFENKIQAEGAVRLMKADAMLAARQKGQP